MTKKTIIKVMIIDTMMDMNISFNEGIKILKEMVEELNKIKKGEKLWN